MGKRITLEEVNVIRYISGYVCRKKIEDSSLANKDDLVLCLLGMGGDEERVESDESEEWLNTIDRGGLCRVSDQTYSFFYNRRACASPYDARRMRKKSSFQSRTVRFNIYDVTK